MTLPTLPYTVDNQPPKAPVNSPTTVSSVETSGNTGSPTKWRIRRLGASWGLLVAAIVGGLGGAVLVGLLLEEITRPILGLQDPDIGAVVVMIIVLAVLMIIGTVALVLAFYVENTVLKTLIITFSLPVPIIYEVVDLTLRFINILNDFQPMLY